MKYEKMMQYPSDGRNTSSITENITSQINLEPQTVPCL